MKQVVVALIGRPSSGKSTFVNTITENKISIVSSIPQSTLSTTNGIYINGDYRFIFLDTPGLYSKNSNFNMLLRKQSLSAIRDCDAILYVIDGKDEIKQEEEKVCFYAKTSKKPTVILINKSDILKDNDIQKVRTFLSQQAIDTENIHVGSALNDIGLDDVLISLKKYARESDADFPDDIFTSSSLEFRAAEVIREIIFENYIEEIPHSVCAVLDEIQSVDNKVYLSFILYCEKESQKGILIGNKGAMINKVKNIAIKRLKNIFIDSYIELSIKVKVKKDWKRDRTILEKLGF